MTSDDDDAPVRPEERDETDRAPSDGAVSSGTVPRRKKRARRRDATEDAASERAAVPSAAAPPGAVVAPREVAIDEPGVVAVRHQLLVAAGAAAAGVAMVGTGPSDLGMWVSIVGGIGLVASIHRLGRLGPPAVPGGAADGSAPPRIGSDRGA